MHIGRGLYYGSYRAPRVWVWSIGVIILILMMANYNWPNCNYDIFCLYSSMIPFNKPRTKAILRIGPHDKDILDLILCGMLGDLWADKIPGKSMTSTRFHIEQSITNAAYIHSLTYYFYKLGYCARPVPALVKKSGIQNITSSQPEDRFNYRLTLFTFTSFNWIYDSFYTNGIGGNVIKKVPLFIPEYLTARGLAHWIQQDGSYQKGQGLSIATHSFTYEECKFLALILSQKYNFKTSVIKSGKPNQWRVSIWKESMPNLVELVKPYFIPEMVYKLKGYL